MIGKKRPILVDATTTAALLNRWVAYVVWRKFDDSCQERNHIVLKETHQYVIQWQNIKADLRGLFSNPFGVVPRVIFSLLAFLFIAIGQHEKAQHTAFELPLMIGAIAYDTAAPSDDVGEVSNIQYNITIGSGSDRYVLWDLQGFGQSMTATFDGNAGTLVINKSGDQKVWGHLNPGTGSKTISISTTSGNSIMTSVAIAFSGVDQTTPTGATNYAESGNPRSVSLTTTTDDAMRVDFGVAINDNAAAISATFDGNAPDTSWNGAQNQFRVFTAVAHTAQAVAGSDSMSWSFTNAGFYQLGYAVEVIASGGGGGETPELVDMIGAGMIPFPRT